MKTLNELKVLRDDALKRMTVRSIKDGFRIQVGMGTCGIAAGARPILNAFFEQIEFHDLKNITITQVGCMGNCAFEPMVEIIDSSGQSFLYVSITIPMVRDIVEKHIINNTPIQKYILNDKRGK